MERHVSKRRRVHPMKPNTLVREEFARKYFNHLVPSLLMIKKNEEMMLSGEKGENGALEKVVRHQVSMALALSAKGFAWGCALKDDLRQSACNIDQERKLAIDEKESTEEEEDFDDDEKIVKEKLKSLRSILPGGDEIESIHALLGELGCYIICLESQVNVLRCLIDQQQH